MMGSILIRLCETIGGRNKEVLGRLRLRACHVRLRCIGKKYPRGNVAVLEYWPYCHNRACIVEATSQANSPAPLPKSKRDGGFFDPSWDPVSERVMDTDSEYRLLSRLANILVRSKRKARGTVYLYTERAPCESCKGVIAQFEQMFPMVRVKVSFDHPYP